MSFSKRAFFGLAVDLDGDTAVVRAPWDGPIDRKPAAYVYTRDGETWSEAARIALDDEPDLSVGHAVAVEGDTVFVSVARTADSTGAPRVLIYRRGPTGFALTQTLVGSGEDAISGIVGAVAGSVWVGGYLGGEPFVLQYQEVDGRWEERCRYPLIPDRRGPNAVSERHLLLGWSGADVLGSVRIHTNPEAVGREVEGSAGAADASDEGGCSCRVADERALGGNGAVALLFLGLVVHRLRRAARDSREGRPARDKCRRRLAWALAEEYADAQEKGRFPNGE